MNLGIKQFVMLFESMFVLAKFICSHKKILFVVAYTLRICSKTMPLKPALFNLQ